MTPARWLMLFGLALVLAAAAVFQFWLAPQLQGPMREGVQLVSAKEERLSTTLPMLGVTQATVLAETDQTITVRFSYTGKPAGLALSACGDITENTIHGPWGCQPRRLTSGSGQIDIHYVLASGDRPRECSDQLSVAMYGDDGSIVYRHVFTLSKVWHREPGRWSWYRYKHEGCPLRTGA